MKVFLILAVSSAAAGFVFRKQLHQFALSTLETIQQAVANEMLKEHERSVHLFAADARDS